MLEQLPHVQRLTVRLVAAQPTQERRHVFAEARRRKRIVERAGQHTPGVQQRVPARPHLLACRAPRHTLGDSHTLEQGLHLGKLLELLLARAIEEVGEKRLSRDEVEEVVGQRRVHFRSQPLEPRVVPEVAQVEDEAQEGRQQHYHAEGNRQVLEAPLAVKGAAPVLCFLSILDDDPDHEETELRGGDCLVEVVVPRLDVGGVLVVERHQICGGGASNGHLGHRVVDRHVDQQQRQLTQHNLAELPPVASLLKPVPQEAEDGVETHLEDAWDTNGDAYACMRELVSCAWGRGPRRHGGHGDACMRELVSCAWGCTREEMADSWSAAPSRFPPCGRDRRPRTHT